MAATQTMKLITSCLDINKAFFYHCLKLFPGDVEDGVATGEILNVLAKADTSGNVTLWKDIDCVLDPEDSGPNNVVKYKFGPVAEEQLAAPSLGDLKALCYFLDKMESTYYVHLDVYGLSPDDLMERVKNVFEKLDAKRHSSNVRMMSTHWTVVILFTDATSGNAQIYRVRLFGEKPDFVVDLDSSPALSPVRSSLNLISNALSGWIFGTRRDVVAPELTIAYEEDHQFGSFTRNNTGQIWTTDLSEKSRRRAFVSLLLAPNATQLGEYTLELMKGVIWCYYRILESASLFADETEEKRCQSCERPHPHQNVWFVDPLLGEDIPCSSIGRLCGVGIDNERMLSWQLHRWQTRKEKAIELSGKKRTSGSLLLTTTPEATETKKTRHDESDISIPPTQLFAGQHKTQEVIASVCFFLEEHHNLAVGADIHRIVTGGNDRFGTIANIGKFRSKVANDRLGPSIEFVDLPLNEFLTGHSYKSSTGTTKCSSTCCNNDVYDLEGRLKEQARRCDLCFLFTCGANCLSEGICTACRESFFCSQWLGCTNKKGILPQPWFSKVDEEGKPCEKTSRGHLFLLCCMTCQKDACAFGGCTLNFNSSEGEFVHSCLKCAKDKYLNCSCEKCQAWVKPPSDSKAEPKQVRLERCATCNEDYSWDCQKAKSHPTKGKVCGSNDCLGFAEPIVQPGDSDCPFCPNTVLVSKENSVKGEQFLWRKPRALPSCWKTHPCKAWIRQRTTQLKNDPDPSIAKLLAQSMKNVTEGLEMSKDCFFLNPDDFDRGTTLVKKLRLLVPVVLEVFASKHNSNKDSIALPERYAILPLSKLLDENNERAYWSKPNTNQTVYQKLLPFLSRATIYRIRKCIDTIQQDGFADRVKNFPKIEVYNQLMLALVAFDPFNVADDNLFFSREWWKCFSDDDRFLIFKTKETLYAGYDLDHTICVNKDDRKNLIQNVTVDSIIERNEKLDPMCGVANCKKAGMLTLRCSCCIANMCPDHVSQCCANCARTMVDPNSVNEKSDPIGVKERSNKSDVWFTYPSNECRPLHWPRSGGPGGILVSDQESRNRDRLKWPATSRPGTMRGVSFLEADKSILEQKGRFANDNIVNFGLLWLTRHYLGEEADADDVVAVASWFLTGFGDDGKCIQNADRYCKNITNVFGKKLILMPLNTPDIHWSLVVIVNPGAILDERKKCVILHFDSCGLHKTSLFHDNVLAWLNYRWKEEHPDTTDDVFTAKTMEVVAPKGTILSPPWHIKPFERHTL